MSGVFDGTAACGYVAVHCKGLPADGDDDGEGDIENEEYIEPGADGEGIGLVVVDAGDSVPSCACAFGAAAFSLLSISRDASTGVSVQKQNTGTCEDCHPTERAGRGLSWGYCSLRVVGRTDF